jgi:hypothetical protein
MAERTQTLDSLNINLVCSVCFVPASAKERPSAFDWWQLAREKIKLTNRRWNSKVTQASGAAVRSFLCTLMGLIEEPKVNGLQAADDATRISLFNNSLERAVKRIEVLHPQCDTYRAFQNGLDALLPVRLPNKYNREGNLVKTLPERPLGFEWFRLSKIYGNITRGMSHDVVRRVCAWSAIAEMGSMGCLPVFARRSSREISTTEYCQFLADKIRRPAPNQFGIVNEVARPKIELPDVEYIKICEDIQSALV